MSEKIMEFRLSWEMPTDHQLIAAIELRYGKTVWPRYDWDKLELGKWSVTEVLWRNGDQGDHLDQHATLKKWAKTREQPIRNVKLECRPVDIGDWELVE